MQFINFASAFFLSLAFLLHNVCGFQITNDPSGLAGKTFSYVIVGGGTAGLTVANRLTENPKTTVLVIESGQDKRNDTRITDPGNFGVADFSDLTWGLTSTNQTVGGRSQSLTIGKVLGGSSAINGMMWTRGTVAQYDAIEALGNPGWNFASLQYYMKKAETFRLPNPSQLALGVTFDPTAHGESGRVISGFPNPYPCPLCNLWDALIDSATAIYPGLRTGGDIDQCSGEPNGAARCIYSIIPGSGAAGANNTRSSSVQSFIYSLAPSDRPNLHILVEHRVTKILWDSSSLKKGQTPTARGVAFQAQDSPNGVSTVNVQKEVIITAGTYGTPKLLELSGVGNATLLTKLGIPVTVDLPSVGTNLQDQSLIEGAYLSPEPLNTSLTHAPTTGVAVFLTLPQMLGEQDANAYVQSLNSTISQRAADIVAAGAGVSRDGVEKMLGLQLKQFAEQNAPVAEITYGAILPQTFGSASWILLPQSRGTAHISSSDPQSPPTINPNYLGTPEDFSLLVNISLAIREIFNVPAAKAFYTAELLPGPTVQTLEQFNRFVLNNYVAVLHPIGTASMLPRNLGGVVDSNLRVYGTNGVRVADASILPLQLSSHLSSTVYGIAEKAADLIIGSQ